MTKVSILLPTFNASRHLDETLDSVLSQEGVDFEVIVLDDVSTDDTVDRVRARNDPRIRIHVNEANLGTPSNVNQGLAMARGQYIARIDHDDIALPGRFAAQAAELDARPEITILGAQIEHFDDEVFISDFPLHHDAITARFIGGYAYIANPTVMFRADFVKSKRIFYDSNLYVVDDLGFFYDCVLAGAKTANLPGVYLKYRIHKNMTSKNLDVQRLFDSKKRIFTRILPKYFPNISCRQLDLLLNLYEFTHSASARDMESLKRLSHAVGRAASYVDPSLGQNPHQSVEMLLGLFQRFVDFLVTQTDALTVDQFHEILAPIYYSARDQAPAPDFI